jgi:hypothetical protein
MPTQNPSMADEVKEECEKHNPRNRFKPGAFVQIKPALTPIHDSRMVTKISLSKQADLPF